MARREGYAVEKRYRSRRAELTSLRADMCNEGVPIRQIAHLIKSRFNVNSRIAYRYAHGLTQQQVADIWNGLWPSKGGEPMVTHKHLSYWESWPLPSGRPPSLDTLNRLARIYRTSAAELLDGDDYTEARDTCSPSQLEPGTSSTPATTGSRSVSAAPSDILARVDAFIAASGHLLATREGDYRQLVQELIEWACRMKRRDILQWLSCAAAAASAAPVLNGLDDDERERVALAIASPSRVDNEVVDHVDAVLWRCMRQDDALGPQAALDTVLAQHRLVRGFLPEASGRLRNRLLSQYANLSRFAGWLSFDLNNYEASSEYYEIARAAAHEAHDTELGAFVLCNMSQLAAWRHQPRVGIDHALASLGWANRTDDPRLRAYALDVAARVFAMDGQDRAALNAVDQARHLLAEQTAAPAGHVYFYGPGLLAGTESLCRLYLGDAVRGADAAEQALAIIDPSFVRNLALVSLRLGYCRLRAAKPDVAGGAQAITDAARFASHNRSARLLERVRHGWRELEPWRDVPEVRAARDRLAAVYGAA